MKRGENKLKRAEEFARHARINFVKLRTANDRRDLATVREFLTAALANEIEADMHAGGDAPQKTDVVTEQDEHDNPEYTEEGHAPYS